MVNRRIRYIRALGLLAVLLAAVSATACGPIDATVGASVGDSGGYQTEHTDPREDVMLIYQYTNWAWEYQNHGYFVTVDGDVYDFDFSDYDETVVPNGTSDVLTYLVDVAQSTEPSKHVDVSGLEGLLLRVDSDARVSCEDAACDAGQWTLYGVRSDSDGGGMEVFKLYSDGDRVEVLQDYYAKKLCKRFLGADYLG